MGGRTGSPQGNSNFDPASIGDGQMPEGFDPDNMPQMPQGGGSGGRGERPDRQQGDT